MLSFPPTKKDKLPFLLSRGLPLFIPLRALEQKVLDGLSIFTTLALFTVARSNLTGIRSLLPFPFATVRASALRCVSLYDDLEREEARMLAQMRTGMARVNGYFCQIEAVKSEKCQCGKDRETVEHFLLECPQWEDLRQELLHKRENRKGNLSFFLGGKESTDCHDWAFDMKAVRAATKFAIATKRPSYVPQMS